MIEFFVFHAFYGQLIKFLRESGINWKANGNCERLKKEERQDGEARYVHTVLVSLKNPDFEEELFICHGLYH